MYGYIYKFTIIQTGKYYIGQHKFENKTVLDENYGGSGLLGNNALQKYGKESVIREILEWCNSPNELDKAEEYGINKLKATNRDIGYNIQDKCYGWDTRTPDKKSFIEKQRESQLKIGTPERRAERSSLMKEINNRPEVKEKLRRPRSEETRRKLSELNTGENNPNGGLKRSEETKAKQRAAKLGKKASEEAKQNMRKPKSEEHKKHLSEAKLGTKGNHHIQLQLYIDDSLVGIYGSVSDAGKILNEYIIKKFNIDFGAKYCSSKIYKLLDNADSIKFHINKSRKNVIIINNVKVIRMEN